MNDYRGSHLARGRGTEYDKRYCSRAAELFYWETYEKPCLIQLWGQHYTPGFQYLDFAAGTARIASAMTIPQSQITMLDISQVMLEEARKKLPEANIICRDVTVELTPLGPFDIITSFRFILNAQDELRIQALSWLRSVIKNNGVLIINNHANSRSIFGLFTRLRNVVSRSNRNHLSDEEVTSILNQVGFEIVETYGFRLLPTLFNRPVLPLCILKWVEDKLLTISFLKPYTKDRIYLCRPSMIPNSAENQ